MTYDPTKISYSQILDFFYRTHDPTTKDQQGHDRGSQYRSAIFFHDAEQERIAKEITKKVNEQWDYAEEHGVSSRTGKDKVVTEILPAGQWWDAEKYHQRYLDYNPGGYECAMHYVRNFAALK